MSLIERHTVYGPGPYKLIHSDKFYLINSVESYHKTKISGESFLFSKEKGMRERFRLYSIKEDVDFKITIQVAGNKFCYQNINKNSIINIIIETQDISILNKFTQINYDTSYKNGKLHGNQKIWYHNGNLLSNNNYKKGKLHSNCYFYTKNRNSLIHSFYWHGKKHEKYKIYNDDPEGNRYLIEERIYNYDNLINMTQFNCNGEIIYKDNFD